eukprot:scaffold396264_cov44-Attheya_sp.AAC.1
MLPPYTSIGVVSLCVFILIDINTSILILEPCQTAIVLQKRQRHRQGHFGGARSTYPFLRVPDVCRRFNVVILCHPRPKCTEFKKALRKSLLKLDALYTTPLPLYLGARGSNCVDMVMLVAKAFSLHYLSPKDNPHEMQACFLRKLDT